MMATPDRSQRSALHALPLLLLAIAILAFSYRTYSLAVPTFYGIADEHGYMMTAKRLATHGAIAQRQPDPYAFIGETMMQSAADPAVYYLRQPIGYPLLLAAAYWIDGPDAPFFVNPLLGVALLAAVHLIGKELGAPLMGAIAALFLSAHPLILYYTLTPLSHIPDMAVAAWAVAFALLWRREKKPWQAAACGLLLGAAILIRYTNILLLLPLGVVLFEQAKTADKRNIWRNAVIAGASTILILVPLFIYHAIAFGSPFRTGYSAGGNATSFSISWLIAHTPAMTAIVFWPGTGLSILLLGVLAGIVVLAMHSRFTLALLLAWGVPPLLLYTAYYGMPENNTLLYARFALSAFPALVLLAVIWPAYLPKQRFALSIIAAALTAVAIFMSSFSTFMQNSLQSLNDNMLAAFTIGNMARKDLPPGSVIVADVFTQYFLDYVGDYTVYTADMYINERFKRRLADLNRLPHENDPARTRQMADLLGGKTDEELMKLLRERLAAYEAKGTPVFMLTLKTRGPVWSHLLRANIVPVDATPGDGDLVLCRLDFPPLPQTTAPATTRAN